MISRRQLRVKVLQMLYAYYTAETEDISKAMKELEFSVDKSCELYLLLLSLVIEIRDYAISRIEIAQNKLLPDYEDINPNKRFIENSFISQLSNNKQLERYYKVNSYNWTQYSAFIKDIYNELVNSENYNNYMKAENNSYSDDKQIVEFFYSWLVPENNDLPQILEEMSIYWNDDLYCIIPLILKTIKNYKINDNPDKKLISIYKNEEDREFLISLYHKSILNKDTAVKLIQETANNWDIERIAFIDILIMQMAITEFTEFQSIPTKVTLNEYLDIAKYYSTEKSNAFINGILDKILISLRKEEKIKKTGRGLIGEN